MKRGEIGVAYVRALRDDAATRGDLALIALCDVALNGEGAARRLGPALPEEFQALPESSLRDAAWERCVCLIGEATLR